MRTKRIILAAAFLCFFFCNNLKSQDAPVHPSLVDNGKFFGITPPLRDLPALSAEEFAIMKEKADKKRLNMKLRFRSYPYADIALPKGPDPIWQTYMGSSSGSKAPLVNFDGQTSPYYPPDANGTAGPNHYMQTINTVFAIYNKSGTLLAGPTNMNLLFSGVPGSNCNDGDPLVLYDDQADRWLAVEFSLCNSNNYMLVAVSMTNDPTGMWYKYSFDVDDMPDYEKFGVWQDGYYMGDNNSPGKDIYVFERSQMLIGGASPQMVGFDNNWRPTTLDGFMCVPPVDNDGAFAPAGSPGLFIAFNDDAIGGGSDELWIYELAVNWTNPGSSTFTRAQQLAVPSFDSNFGTSWSNIPQAGTSQKLDAIPQVIMNIPQYRNFDSYQTLVCCHTVDVDATNHAGIRWYELRKTTGSWSIRQSGTYAPDSHSRWMGSIALNGSGQIGLGYSVSSSTMYPSIRYCGQSAGAYASATGILDIPEESIQEGTNSQTAYNRWGDYSCTSIDPSDDKTFWFTTEYIGSGGTRKTKIASFTFGNSPTVNTLAATAVTETSATLNGTINPNGLATTYYFQWGTTTAYGNTTTSGSAGSGSANVNVSAGITGLSGGTTYHFRLVGTNSDGTTNGNDMTFTPSAAIVTTTPASSIGPDTAVAGGNVISDGGSPVTARGVCWNTSSNPTISNNHTTDGTGTGAFTSVMTGLSPNTTYHVRAYATNSYGTTYGADISFTTACTIASLPVTENFNLTSFPSCWTQQISGSGAINSWSVSSTNKAGGSPNEMKSTWQSVNPGVTRLVSLPINTMGVTQLNLSFRHMLDAFSTGATLCIQSSANGSSWTNEAWSVSTTSSNINATIVNTTISNNLNSATTYIAFTITGDLYQYDYWYIDNVQITGCAYLPVSVTISASATTVCAGTSVTFTATPTNGGTAPVYQWKVNGSNVGTNNPVYTYTPANNDVITCVLTSNATCATGNPATSNAVTMTVYPLLSVSISVAESQNNVCASTSVIFTATPTNGGTTPSYQWKVNGTNAGTNSPIFIYSPANNDVVTCVLTSNVICPTGNPATSNAITMNVYPLLPVSVSVTENQNNICAGTMVIFTATPTNGGPSPVYHWKVNGSDVGTNSIFYSYTPSDGDMVSCVLTSNATCTTGNPATSNAITMTVYPLLPVSVSIAGSHNNVCAGTSVTFTATPTNGGTAPSYQWKVNGVNAGTNSNVYTYIPSDGDVVTCVMTSNATCATGNPATSNAVTMTVYPLLPVSVSVTENQNNVCTGTLVTFTATPTNGGTAPSCQWKVNGTNTGTNSPIFTYSPANNDAVTCVLTSNATCTTGNPATSNAITMTVYPLLPISVSIAGSHNNVCAGTSVTFTATPTNGGTAPYYQWKINGYDPGINSEIFTYVPSDGDVVTCVMTSNATCPTGNPATSNAITMTIYPFLPINVSIVENQNNVCAGTLVTFTAIPTNGGTAPSYQWKVNGSDVGTNSIFYSYTPSDGDMVSCMLTSNATCATGNPATSNTVIMTVYPLLPVSVSIAENQNNICAGTLVTFTAIPTNGGTAPSYQWKVNGSDVGTNSIFYSYTPSDGDMVSCVLTSNATCPTGNPATSNAISMTVYPLLPVSVSITENQNNICAGTSVTFTANPTNGGTAPSYQWKVNGYDLGINSEIFTYVPSDGDIVTCVLTSDATCATGNPATSNPIAMFINPIPYVTNTPLSENICSGTNTNILLQSNVPGTLFVYAASPSSTNIIGFSDGTGNTIDQTLINTGSIIETVAYNIVPYTTSGCFGNPANYIVTVHPSPNVIFQPSSLTISSGQTTNILLGSDIAGTTFAWTAAASSSDVSGYSNGSGDTIIQTIINPTNFTQSVYYLVTPSANGCDGSAVNYTVEITPSLLQNITLQDITIPADQSICYNALQTITVAGHGTTFTVELGGSATMIAGQNIIYYPGTLVEYGGYLHGYIAPAGPFCGGQTPSMVDVINGEDEIHSNSEQSFFKVYPNPTTGNFILEFTGDNKTENYTVEVYNMWGEKVLADILPNGRKHELSLLGHPVGLYFIRVNSGQINGIKKIIKQE